MKGLQLIATGRALPRRTVTNEDLSRWWTPSDEWITTRTGIRSRHWCAEDESAATLAIAAARQALERSGLSAADIDCCICATLSAPNATPSVACQIQRALGLPEDRPALDVNAACSGFVYGTAVARGLLATMGGRYALVVGSEALSRLMDPTDRSTCVLFGDGAGAAIYEWTDTPFAITLGARGDEAIHARRAQPGRLCTHRHGRQGGLPLCGGGPAARAWTRCLTETHQHAGRGGLGGLPSGQQPHPWAGCIKQLHADPAKFYKNMDRHGNTSAASIPVALQRAEPKAGLPAARARPLACIGFGGGPDLGRHAL